MVIDKGVGRNISRGGEGQRRKDRKIAKKTEKIALLSLFQEEGGNGKKDRKIAKTPKNSTFKPFSNIFAPCIKIQGGMTPRPPLPTPMVID